MGCLRLVDRWRYKWSSGLRVVHVKKGVTSNDWVKRVCSSYFFGMLMPDRQDELSGRTYTYGYNTQERVDEIKGAGKHYTAKFWEYDPRVVTRWNVDPITYPWQSPYAINNGSPILFADPLGLFGTRKEARKYKKEHGLKGRIRRDKSDGIFSIDNGKEGTSIFKDPSMDNVPNLIGRQEDGTIKGVLLTDKKPGGTNHRGGGFFSDGIWTLGFTGTAAAGPVGGSFEIGFTLDFRDGFELGGYATAEHSMGADLSVGGVLNYHKPVDGSSNFSRHDLEGWGESYNGTFLIVDGTYGGDSFYPRTLNPKYHRRYHPTYNTYGGSFLTGFPLRINKNKGYTWIRNKNNKKVNKY